MLSTTRYHQPWGLADLFDDGQWCPICHGRAFTHCEGAGIECDECGATFALRSTAGDPGVVIDCWGNPQGKYAAIVPGIHGTIYYFWQVVKECEAGLDDRQRWCSHSGTYGHTYRATDPLLFAEVYHFDHYETARQLAHDRWRKTPTGRKLSAELAAAAAPVQDKPIEVVQASARLAMISTADDDRAAWNAYYEVLRRWQSSIWEYERLHIDEIERTLRDHKPGLYFTEQCEKTWPDDSFWLHRCLPKAGEQPRVAHPFYHRRDETGEPPPARAHLASCCAALGEAIGRHPTDHIIDRWMAAKRAAEQYLQESR